MSHDNLLIRNLTWLEIDAMDHELALKVKQDQYEPDVIIGLVRGGMIPAVHLSHLLKVRLTYPLWVKRTESDDAYSNRIQPLIKGGEYLGDIQAKRILVVDEVTNSGETLEAVKDYLWKVDPLEIKTATLVWNSKIAPEGMVKPPSNYNVHITEVWVNFPWES